jgi:hypothetical protein
MNYRFSCCDPCRDGRCESAGCNHASLDQLSLPDSVAEDALRGKGRHRGCLCVAELVREGGQSRQFPAEVHERAAYLALQSEARTGYDMEQVLLLIAELQLKVERLEGRPTKVDTMVVGPGAVGIDLSGIKP